MTTCSYCGVLLVRGDPVFHPTKDHVIPVSGGGKWLGHVNIVPACKPCNAMKGNLTASALEATADDLEDMARKYRGIANRTRALIKELNLAPEVIA